MTLAYLCTTSTIAPVDTYLKEHFIDTGKLGVDMGEGFYTYPNPVYHGAGLLDLQECPALFGDLEWIRISQ
jgi:hypothetical protein